MAFENREPYDCIPSIEPDVIGKMVDNEAVLVHAQRGEVKVLNEVGARIWSLIDGQRNVAMIAQIISHEYRVEENQAKADTLSFVEKLVNQGILKI